MSSLTRRITCAAGAVLSCIVMAASPPTASASPHTTAGQPVTAADGSSWRVDRVPAGYRVELRTATDVHSRAAAPLLVADGRILGVGQVTSSRTVVATTSDASVLGARSLVLRWSSGFGSLNEVSGERATPTPPAARAAAPVLDIDPGKRGPLAVSSGTYDFGDTALELDALPGSPVEKRGVVFWPTKPPAGPRPVVLFLHGMHDWCYTEGGGGHRVDEERPWPCAEGQLPVPSHRGYDRYAATLASHGYVVVSVSAGGVNAYSNLQLDLGAKARGELMLETLDLLAGWNSTGGEPFGSRFVGRLDLDRVGLMGHSRGGEGAVRAAVMNAARPEPYGVRAVLPLAPTDNMRQTLPDTSMSVVLPECDGDVFDLEGQHYFDDSRYADEHDNAARSVLFVHGANHNFFNTEWTPGTSVAPSFDDWSESPGDESCRQDQPSRLTAEEQQVTGNAIVAGFFRAYLGREQALLPFFDGSGARPASLPTVLDVQAQQPERDRVDLARFHRSVGTAVTQGDLRAEICRGATSPEDYYWPEGVPNRDWCTTRLNPILSPHWVPAFLAHRAPTTTVGHLTWRGAGALTVPVPRGAADARGYDALTFRAAPDVPRGAPQDLVLRVTDARGAHDDVRIAAISPALQRLPAIGDVPGKVMLRQVHVPLASLSGVDLARLRSVEMRSSGTGGVYVSDFALARRSLGSSGPPDLPQASIADLRVREGSSDTARRMKVSLSAPATQLVRLHVTLNPAERLEGVSPVYAEPLGRPIVLRPGQRSTEITVRTEGDTLDQADERRFVAVLVARHGAVAGRNLAIGTILDDDPTPTLVLGPAEARESDDRIAFPLTLSQPSGRAVVVAVQTIDGTATTGQDFGFPEGEGIYEGYVPEGQTTGWVEIPLVGDRRREATETFQVQLISVIGGVLDGPSVVTGTIVDDD